MDNLRIVFNFLLYKIRKFIVKNKMNKLKGKWKFVEK